MMKKNYNIKTILESLKEDVGNGKISIREAAVELHKAGWTNFIDIDATRNLLKFRQSDESRRTGKSAHK
uniref:HEAT repeat associated with sister chromatid cohesion n=1 Tax=virus sp. ct5rm7 TaxID=2827298 RepID=A0A8S5RH01_9VIRU|nr:MAG TPA: HEAT repeat associated with sister chromatid cohesion [virus sp. ct5rm7]